MSSAVSCVTLVTLQKHIDVAGIAIELFDHVQQVLSERGGPDASSGSAPVDDDAGGPGAFMRSPSLPHFHAHLLPRIRGETVTVIAATCDQAEGDKAGHSGTHASPLSSASGGVLLLTPNLVSSF
jgi:hypothetical protein